MASAALPASLYGGVWEWRRGREGDWCMGSLRVCDHVCGTYDHISRTPTTKEGKMTILTT